MKQFPPALRSYLVVVWALGLLAWSASWFLHFDSRALSWPLAAVLLALVIVAQSLPHHVLRGIKFAPDTLPLFIAVLSLPLSAAVNIALVGTVIAQALRRRPGSEVAFNAAVTTLGVFGGGIICAGLMAAGATWGVPVAALISAAVFYLANSSLVAGAVTLQHRLSYGRIWRDVVGAEPLDHVLMFLVAGLVALPWAWKPIVAGLLATGLAMRIVQTRYTVRQVGA